MRSRVPGATNGIGRCSGLYFQLSVVETPRRWASWPGAAFLFRLAPERHRRAAHLEAAVIPAHAQRIAAVVADAPERVAEHVRGSWRVAELPRCRHRLGHLAVEGDRVLARRAGTPGTH